MESDPAGRERRIAVDRERRSRHGAASAWSTAAVGPVFLLAAGWFLWGPQGVELPDEAPRPVEASLISTAPPRRALTDPPTIVVDGSPRTCADCHRLFRPAEDAPLGRTLHRHITLDHGINRRCRNCHHVENRDKLVLHDGTVISYSDTPLLCAKCHGPTYRDWEHGAHGRTNGYWDASRGEMRRLKCSECHDPHTPRVPAMDPLIPLPGPRTPGLHAAEEPGSRETRSHE